MLFISGADTINLFVRGGATSVLEWTAQIFDLPNSMQILVEMQILAQFNLQNKIVFILPLSHDEVVHGKGSILSRMPGDDWQKFANVRSYYGFMWGHPGKKLIFMGDEFAQGAEWNHDTSLDWHQLDNSFHKGVQLLVCDLNQFYRNHVALFTCDSSEEGFEWVEADDHHHSIFAYVRIDPKSGKRVIVVSNFTPVPREGYRLGVSEQGVYHEVLNTDLEKYGGSGVANLSPMASEDVSWHYRKQSIVMNIPPLATVFIERQT